MALNFPAIERCVFSGLSDMDVSGVAEKEEVKGSSDNEARNPIR